MDITIFITTTTIALILTSVVVKKGNLGIAVGIGGVIVVGIIAGIIVSGVSLAFGGLNTVLLTFLEIGVVLGVGVLCTFTMFYRDPERYPPHKEGIIVSPADGKIRYIKKIKKGKIPLAIKGKNHIRLSEITKTTILDNGGYIIGISMCILDVHVNRAPISGKVVFLKYTPGNFLSLKKVESESQNERNTIVIDNNSFNVGVVQIASRLVRRIVSYSSEGDFVEIGERIGIIKFGSQVDIVIPNMELLRINVREGEQVYAGTSIIAEYA